jgi:transcriptional regulator with XRE-family HTH domain
MIKNEQERQRIGQRIAAIRKSKELTQGELAERCGLAQSHIARIEAGRYSVGFDTLQQIAEALGCTIDLV